MGGVTKAACGRVVWPPPGGWRGDPRSPGVPPAPNRVGTTESDLSPDTETHTEEGHIMDPNTTAERTGVSPWLLLLRIAVGASLAALLWEFVTAGQLITFNMDALPLHYGGAFAVHATTGVQLLAALLVWRLPGTGSRGGPRHDRLVAVVSLLAFAVGFPQAALGTYGPLQAHVPLAMLLVALVMWSAVLVWRRQGDQNSGGNRGSRG